MKVRISIVCMLAVCMLTAMGAPAVAGSFLDGNNIYQGAKNGGNWVAQMSNPGDPSLHGVAHILETVCGRGIGVSFVAPQAAAQADHGVMTVITDGGQYDIPIARHQLGFLFVLECWPDPWPFGPVYSPDGNPMFVEWSKPPLSMGLTPDELHTALDSGAVSISIYDAAGALVLTGVPR